jgi:hypothetical protein
VLDEGLAEMDDQLEAAVGHDRLRLDLGPRTAQAPQAPDERLELGARRPCLVAHVGNLQDRRLAPATRFALEARRNAMRHLVTLTIPIVLALLIAAPADASEKGSPTPTLADLSWMAGSWASRDGGKLSEEHWTKPAGGLMLGVHRDIGGAKTAFEFLRIEESSGKIAYLASPQGRPATSFELIESTAQRAVFANPQHDFPQRILYWREAESLCAAVEGPMNGETVSERWCWKPAALK